MIDDFRPMKPVKPAPETLENQNPQIPQTSESSVPFVTPDQASQHDSIVPVSSSLSEQSFANQNVKPSKPRGTGHHWFNLPWPPTRHEVILAVLVILLAAAGGTAFTLLHGGESDTQAATTTKPAAKKATTPPAPTTVAATLSGLQVDPAVNTRPVVGAMIENSKDARPQSGLSQAGVVFEAVAEGGITRFLALYQDQQPTNIGPVRSARPYYAQWLMGFNAVYAHVGGSPDALVDIKNWGIQDLNQFYNAAPYHRVTNRISPHNVYASVPDLSTLATQKGFKSNYSGFARKTATPAKTPSATSINVNISSSLYNVAYQYDAASNTYLRSEGGAPQIDANTNKQLAPSVVVTMVVPLGAGTKDAQGSSYSDYNPIGSGVAYIFQDGLITPVTWTKTANAAQITFADASGKPVKLNPGQTWITAVTGTSKVSYK